MSLEDVFGSDIEDSDNEEYKEASKQAEINDLFGESDSEEEEDKHDDKQDGDRESDAEDHEENGVTADREEEESEEEKEKVKILHVSILTKSTYAFFDCTLRHILVVF